MDFDLAAELIFLKLAERTGAFDQMEVLAGHRALPQLLDSHVPPIERGSSEDPERSAKRARRPRITFLAQSFEVPSTGEAVATLEVVYRAVAYDTDVPDYCAGLSNIRALMNPEKAQFLIAKANLPLNDPWRVKGWRFAEDGNEGSLSGRWVNGFNSAGNAWQSSAVFRVLGARQPV